ncbi:hypothetical protein FB446DRAFT_707843 [Lentinula raphanica]|nr:hypothetical protein FB446DRAFT_707843 [Lentinula raphanica]
MTRTPKKEKAFGDQWMQQANFLMRSRARGVAYEAHCLWMYNIISILTSSLEAPILTDGFALIFPEPRSTGPGLACVSTQGNKPCFNNVCPSNKVSPNAMDTLVDAVDVLCTYVRGQGPVHLQSLSSLQGDETTCVKTLEGFNMSTVHGKNQGVNEGGNGNGGQVNDGYGDVDEGDDFYDDGDGDGDGGDE